ncbi:MAG: DUF445 family protein [Bacillota bacterium]
MLWAWVALLPVISALIGWLTNVLAVRLLFRPYQPVRLPLLGYRLQGMLPKYRRELAANVGRLIENELLPVDHLLAHLRSEEMKKELIYLTELAVRARAMDRLPAFLPSSLKRTLGDLLAEQVHKELPALLDELLKRSGQKLKEEFQLGRLVEERLNEFELQKLEEIVLQAAARELRHIEILGGVIGFLIGLLQAGLLLFLNFNHF